jgi:hypothetical protein
MNAKANKYLTTVAQSSWAYGIGIITGTTTTPCGV